MRAILLAAMMATVATASQNSSAAYIQLATKDLEESTTENPARVSKSSEPSSTQTPNAVAMVTILKLNTTANRPVNDTYPESTSIGPPQVWTHHRRHARHGQDGPLGPAAGPGRTAVHGTR